MVHAVAVRSDEAGTRVGQARTWIIGVYGIFHLSEEEKAELKTLGENFRFAESDDEQGDGYVVPIRWTGGWRGFRDDAKEGDSVIQIDREHEASKVPSKVVRHAKIIRIQHCPRRTWFVVQSVIESLPWAVFQDRVSQNVRGLGSLGPNSARVLSDEKDRCLRREDFWAEDE